MERVPCQSAEFNITSLVSPKLYAAGGQTLCWRMRHGPEGKVMGITSYIPPRCGHKRLADRELQSLP